MRLAIARYLKGGVVGDASEAVEKLLDEDFELLPAEARHDPEEFRTARLYMRDTRRALTLALALTLTLAPAPTLTLTLTLTLTSTLTLTLTLTRRDTHDLFSTNEKNLRGIFEFYSLGDDQEGKTSAGRRLSLQEWECFMTDCHLYDSPRFTRNEAALCFVWSQPFVTDEVLVYMCVYIYVDMCLCMYATAFVTDEALCMHVRVHESIPDQAAQERTHVT